MNDARDEAEAYFDATGLDERSALSAEGPRETFVQGWLAALAHATRGERRIIPDVVVKPRRPYDADRPDGYLESDNDFIANNHHAAILLLEAYATPPPATGEAGSVTPADLARSLDAVAAMIDGATSLDNVARIQRERDEAQKVLTDLLAYIEREHGTDADEGMCDEDDPCDMAVLIKRARAALGLALPASRDASNPGEKEAR